MRRIQSAFAVAAVIALALTVSACGGSSSSSSGASSGSSAGAFIRQIQQHGTLRIGVDEGKPFVFKDPKTGQWKGIFIDMLDEWAQTLKVTVKPVTTTFANMVAGLQANQFDVAVALNPTPERSLSVSFSNPLIYEISAFAVRKDSGLTTWPQINKPSNTICVPQGSAPDLALTSQKPVAKVVRLQSETACQLALISKRVDAFYWAVGNLSTLAKDNGNVGLVFPESPFEREGTAYGLPANIDSQSQAAFNIQLEFFVHSGALEQSERRWGLAGPEAYTLGVLPAYVKEAGY